VEEEEEKEEEEEEYETVRVRKLNVSKWSVFLLGCEKMCLTYPEASSA
jgi:hypothetical protein